MGTSGNIRFGDLVRASGRPQVVTLWTDPRKDRDLMEAVRSGRVLTVVQEPGSKHKDFGLVGFHQQAHASYLVFPRPLEKPAGTRVIGINYLLLEEPQVRDPLRDHEIPETHKTQKPSGAKETQAETGGRREHKLAHARPAVAPQAHTKRRAAPNVTVQPAIKAAASPAKPKTRAYSFTIRRTATVETDLIVEAETQKAARERALTLIKTQPFDMQKASVHEKIIRTK